LLQEADPTGEIECCIDNMDIHFVDRMPAYWDGTLQLLQRDHDCKYYNVIGAKYTSRGDKIKIKYLSITDAIGADENLPIDYSEVGNAERQRDYEASDNKTRAAYRDMHRVIERDHFVRWVTKEAGKQSGDLAEIERVASTFFDANLTANDPLPPDIAMNAAISWYDRREIQWSRAFTLRYDGMDWAIEICSAPGSLTTSKEPT